MMQYFCIRRIYRDKHVLDRMEEQQLAEQCRLGDNRARQELYERYAGRLLALCLRYTGNREQAEDLLHDGFLKLFSSFDKFTWRGEGSLRAWMERVMVNTALEYLRRNDVLRETVDLDDNEPMQEIDTSTIEQMSADELMELVAELPAGFRAVFNLFVVEGYNHKEIGQMLGITESTSRSQLTRAKKWLQKRLNEI